MAWRGVLAVVTAGVLLAGCGNSNAGDGDLRARPTGSTAVTAPAPGTSTATASAAAGGAPTTPAPIVRPSSGTLPVPTVTAVPETTAVLLPPPVVTPPEEATGPVAARGVQPAPASPAPATTAGTGPSPNPYFRTAMGCAGGTGAASLDRFFGDRLGGVMGWDYPHAQPLGNGRVAWFFQDAFVQHGASERLVDARLIRNAAAVQDGTCFTLVHQGTQDEPQAFERGTGDEYGVRWWWPLGSAVRGDVVQVLWAEMAGDATFPRDGVGLPWSPVRTWLGTYQRSNLERLSFRPAPDDGVLPVYGYAVSSDASHTYLFGNSYEQNLRKEGGWFSLHSAVTMYVARVPKGRLDQKPVYWDGSGWSAERRRAVAISRRFGVENPVQPRFLDGRWLAVTKAEGFYGSDVVVDIAPAAQGPWTQVARVPAPKRREDGRLSTYHAYSLPWREPGGPLIVSLSMNDMSALWAPAPEAWMYRPLFFTLPWPPLEPPPPPTTTTTEPPTTPAPTTTEPSTTLAPTTLAPTSTSTTTTTEPPTTPAPTTSSTAASTTTTAAG